MPEGPNFGIDKFGFNFDNSITGTIGLNSIVGPGGWKTTLDPDISDFGRFSFLEKGTGGTRQDALIFTVTTEKAVASSAELEGAFFVANTDGYHFATHTSLDGTLL